MSPLPSPGLLRQPQSYGRASRAHLLELIRLLALGLAQVGRPQRLFQLAGVLGGSGLGVLQACVGRKAWAPEIGLDEAGTTGLLPN